MRVGVMFRRSVRSVVRSTAVGGLNVVGGESLTAFRVCRPLSMVSSMAPLRSKKKQAIPTTENVGLEASPVDLDDVRQHVLNALGHLELELGSLRGGVPSASMLDSLEVEAYGAKQALQSLATTALQKGNTLEISPFDPSTTASIAKSIQESGQSLNPRIENGKIHVLIPKMTGDARESLRKQVSTMAEHTKQHIRRLRQKSMKRIRNATSHGHQKKGGHGNKRHHDHGTEEEEDEDSDDEQTPTISISEDEAATFQKEVEAIIKEANAIIEAAVDKKLAELK